MFALKSCPRCRGDLHKTLDDEITCLQCGYTREPEDGRRPVWRGVRHPQAPKGARAA